MRYPSLIELMALPCFGLRLVLYHRCCSTRSITVCSWLMLGWIRLLLGSESTAPWLRLPLGGSVRGWA